MRLLELHLRAFGPFTDLRLDLSRAGALQLVYGPNEAGKSTMLRAITNLLYGIPAATGDAHRHPMPELRIGASIANNGSVMHLLRRKGAKNTLLDLEERPLGDDALAPFLGGVDEDLFRSMFGLDHVSLRQGAQALLQSKGRVGESLFGAAIGAAGIHAVLAELENVANELYRPRGHTQHLNKAISAFRSAEKRARDTAKSAVAYRLQQDALAGARAESDALAERRRRLSAEQSRLQRALRVLPHLAARERLRREREDLGPVTTLPSDAAEQRLAAQQELADAHRLRSSLEGELSSLEAQRADLRAPASLLETNEQVVDDVQDRLGSHRAAAIDLPKRRSELRLLEESAGAILLRLGRPESLETIEPLRVSPPLQARIRKLAQERSGFATALQHSARELEDRRVLLNRLRRELAALGPAVDLRELQRALNRAQRLGAVDDEIRAASDCVSAVEREMEARLAKLAPWVHDAAALNSLALPSFELVDRYGARFDAIEREAEDLKRRERQRETHTAGLERDLEELRLTGDVPNEEQLGARREQRDALWRGIRTEAEQGSFDRDQADAFERLQGDADNLADRLRREASRVATRAKLMAEMAESARQRQALAGERDDLADRRRRLEEEWSELWRVAAGIVPSSALEMRVWLGRAGEAMELAERLDSGRSALEEAAVRRQGHRDDIVQAVRSLGDAGAPAAERLDKLIDEAERMREQWAEHNARRRELETRIAATEEDLLGVERSHRHSRTELEKWNEDWGRSVAPLDLGVTATVEEAIVVLEELNDLFIRFDRIRELRHRIAAMEGDAVRFRDDVAALASRYAPELSAMPLDECAQRLVRSYHSARNEEEQRQRLDELLARKQEELRACDGRAAAATAVLAALVRMAAVATVDELAVAERKAGQAEQLDRDLREVENKLIEAGDGASIELLIEETHGVDADSVRFRLAEIEEQLEELNEQIGSQRQLIGSLDAGLARWEEGETAADAAAEAQEHLAAIKEHVRRYLRVRLGGVVLRREIERYREQNQGPILVRAGELFPRLTLGAFSALRVGFDAGDDPVLRCVRADGREVGVDNDLSDGTRDQLYLALRVASLELHARLATPMPVVLDDVLIHFDDARAAAALGVLAELAATTQVLLFTHHARVVELARSSLPQTAWVEQRLAARS